MEQLKEYLEKLESADMTAAFCIDGEEEAEVRGVTFDSKEVVSGGIFVCKGKNFRVEYLKEALERGCICYVSEKRYELSEETAWIQVKEIRKAMPVLAAIFYRTEPLPLHLTGVTGTKGKTTTSYYIKAILDVWEKKKQGKETGILSSVEGCLLSLEGAGDAAESSHSLLQTVTETSAFHHGRVTVSPCVLPIVSQSTSTGAFA